MSVFFEADPDALASAVEQAGAVSAALADLAGDVHATVEDLHDTWDGLARLAHEQSHLSWAGDFTQLRAALDGMRTALEGAEQHYRGAADANQHMWSAVQ